MIDDYFFVVRLFLIFLFSLVEDDERGTEEIGIESSDKDEEDEEDYEVDEENDFPSGLHDNQERIRYLLRSNNQKFDKYGNTGNRSHYQAPIMKNFQQIPSALAATNRFVVLT